jgi:hypothetical protein
MEAERIDLSALDPGGWERKATALAARARELRRLRRRVVVRGFAALAISAAAALALWLSAPKPAPRSSPSAFDLLGNSDPMEVLRYAQ